MNKKNHGKEQTEIKKGQTSRLVLFHYLLLSVKSNFVV